MEILLPSRQIDLLGLLILGQPLEHALRLLDLLLHPIVAGGRLPVAPLPPRAPPRPPAPSAVARRSPAPRAHRRSQPRWARAHPPRASPGCIRRRRLRRNRALRADR